MYNNEPIGGFVYLNVWMDEFALIKLDAVSLSAEYTVHSNADCEFHGFVSICVSYEEVY